MPGALLVWWVQQMRSLLPWRRQGGSREVADALVVDVRDQSQVEIIIRRRQRERTLGPLPAGGVMFEGLPSRCRKTLLLRLPAGALLEREVTLPAVAEGHVAEFLGREMDRLTPFTADAIYWQARVIGSDPSGGRRTFRLGIIIKSSLEPLLDRLAKVGLRPTVAEVSAAGGASWRIMLDRSSSVAKQRRRRMLAAVGGLSIVLALLAIGLAFVRQSVVLAGWEAEIAALRPRVDEAAMLRRRIAAGLAGDAAIAAESGRLGNPLQVIAMLTDAVPDNSFLTTLSVRGSELDFAGQTLDAARMIGALVADPRFVNPAFAGAVSRSGDNRRALFSIRTELRHLP